MQKWQPLLQNLQNSTHLNVFTTILFVLGALLIILVAYITIRTLKKNTPKKDGKEKKEVENPRKGRLPPPAGSLGIYMGLKGLWRVDHLTFSFLKALEFLKNEIDHPNYKYALPWYALIGAENSGKTTLLEGSDLSLPLGAPEFTGDQHPGCDWWFLNRGIILDIRGSLLLNQQGLQSDENQWKTFLTLLSRYRGKHPLDGIILTISVEELLRTDPVGQAELEQRAKFLMQKLMASQRSLGVRLPVYVVITKTDLIPGFQSFCKEIPKNLKESMLGWSSPYTVQTAFSPQWIDEAFKSIHNHLHKLRMEIFAHGRVSQEKDGVFVFPSTILSVQNALKNFLSHIFHPSAYQDSLILRGIYFSGDSGISAIQSMERPIVNTNNPRALLNAVGASSVAPVHPERIEREEVPTQTVYTHQSDRHIFFFKDLLSSKVFKETGLSQPIYKRLVTANHQLNIFKFGAVALLVSGSIGSYHAYKRFHHDKVILTNQLYAVNGVIQRIESNSRSVLKANAQTYEDYLDAIKNLMNGIYDTNFWSIWMPSSWFSGLKNRMEGSLKTVYQLVLINTMYKQLALKGHEIISMSPTLQDVSKSIDAYLVPSKMAEYKLLDRYMDRLTEWIHHAKLYNSLQTAPEASNVQILLKYLWGVKASHDFMKAFDNFSGFFHDINIPLLGIKDFEKGAQSTFNNLFEFFYTALFTSYGNETFTGYLQNVLSQFVSQNHKTLHLNAIKLSDFLGQLAEVMPTFPEEGYNWIDLKKFKPFEEFDGFKKKVHDCQLFTDAMYKRMDNQLAIGFNKLQQKLKQLNDQYLSLNDQKAPQSKEKDSKKKEHSSSLLFKIYKSLSTFFAHAFMTPLPTEPKIQSLMSDEIAVWNVALLDSCLQMLQDYETFSKKQLKTFAPGLEEGLHILSKEYLTKNVTNLISRSQEATHLSQNYNSQSQLENLLSDKIRQDVGMYNKIIQLLDLLQKNNIVESFNVLGTNVAQTLYKMLTVVDQVFMYDNFYAIKGNDFSWWNGLSSPIFDAFGVADLESLAIHLDTEREMIRKLAFSYAKPIVDVLKNHTLNTFVVGLPLIQKWDNIINQLILYDQKKPNNTVSSLQNFLLKVASQITLNSAFDAISIAAVHQESPDFFRQRQIAIMRLIRMQAEVLKRQESIRKYTHLSTMFNNSLAGYFPFISGGNISPSITPELDPNILKQFMELYESMGGSTEKVLDQVYQLGQVAQPAVDFLNQLKNLKTFFGTFLTNNPNNEPPYFNFTVEFRANRDRESYGNTVMNWFVQVGQDQLISSRNQQSKGNWRYGQPILVGFEWPQGSPITPQMDPQNSNLAVQGQTATFQYTGNWALLWLIKMQGGYAVAEQGQPYTTQFLVPVSSGGEATLYNRFILFAPGGTVAASGAAQSAHQLFTSLNFPTHAPELDPAIMSVAGQPVLTQGTLIPSPYLGPAANG